MSALPDDRLAEPPGRVGAFPQNRVGVAAVPLVAAAGPCACLLRPAAVAHIPAELEEICVPALKKEKAKEREKQRGRRQRRELALRRACTLHSVGRTLFL